MKSQQDRFYLPSGIMSCLPHARAENKCTTIVNGEIHVLTARERMRLQGFDDDFIDRAYFINEPKILIAQAGNGVTVNVIKAIAEKFSKEGDT